MGELLGRYEAAVYSLCYRMVGNRETARELAQETFLKAITHFERYDGRSRLMGWLMRIATNTCLTHYRRQKHRNHRSLDAPIGGEGESWQLSDGLSQSREPESGSGVAEDNERLAALTRALGLIGPEHRVVLLLRDAHGLEYAAIAEALGIAVGTVKSRLFRARSALRSALGESSMREES